MEQNIEAIKDKIRNCKSDEELDKVIRSYPEEMFENTDLYTAMYDRRLNIYREQINKDKNNYANYNK